MSSEFSSIRTKEKLEIAVSTDTVLYLPFYIAYYNYDFRDTPFADIEVVIIGTKNDQRFDQNKKLKGDGFATFAVLLGLADAAICDPSYFIYLCHCADPALIQQLKLFQDLLKYATKRDISRGFDNENDAVLRECFEVNVDNELVFKDTKAFREKVLQKHTKVIGGLVSKIAFLAVGSEDLIGKESENTEKSLGRLYDTDAKPSPFGKANLKGTVFHYQYPSTGFCIGNIYAASYKSDIPSITSAISDFGLELRNLSSNIFKEVTEDNKKVWKEVDNSSSYCTNSVCFSCDYISIDFLLGKHNGGVNKKVVELEDLACDGKKNFMFTGILGNNQPENSEKLKGLLYGIDNNLYKIQSYLKKSDTAGLIQFLKSKLKYDEDTQELLLDLLIADENLRETIKYDINDKTKAYTFESVLKYYVDRLNEWKPTGNLYYPTTEPIEKDLKELTILRYRTSADSQDAEKFNYANFIAQDLLHGYRLKEQRYFALEKIALNSKHIKRWAWLSPALYILYIYRAFKKNKTEGEEKNAFVKYLIKIEGSLWSFVREPILIYTLGSIFIFLEITSSAFHIGHHDGFKLYDCQWSWTQNIVRPNSKVIDTITYCIPLGRIFFAILFAYLIAIFFSARNLLILKQEGKYFYRK